MVHLKIFPSSIPVEQLYPQCYLAVLGVPLFVFTLGVEYYSILSSLRAETSVDECRIGLLILCLGKFLGSCWIGSGHGLSRIVGFNGTGKNDNDLAQLNLMH